MQNQRHCVTALQSLKSDIADDLVVEYIINFLIDVNVFTPEEGDFILRSGESIGNINDLMVRQKVLRQQTECFVDLMIEKIKNIDFAFNSLTYILFKDDNYPWIAKRLLSKRDELKKLEEMSNKLIETDTKEVENVMICHDIPNKVKNLVKRSDKLNEIRETLIEFGRQGIGWLILNGMGGTGKSILAAEAVRDWKCDHFCDGIWWTNCGNMKNDKKFDESMLLLKMQFLWVRICDQIPERRQYIKFESMESAVHKLKSHFKEFKKSLIILDDVWDKEVLENFQLGVPVLVTTRDINTSVIPNKYEITKRFIQSEDNDYGLSIEESRELLALWVKCQPKELNEEYVNRIIAKLKGNPLCLTLIGNVMEEKGNNSKYWKFYFDSIENSSEKSSPIRRRSSSGTRNNIVYDSLGFDTLVQHSYEALDQSLGDYYKYFALFIEDIRIPIEVFQTVWEMKEIDVDFVMDKLVKKSLVMILKSNEFTLYMVHDIILNFLKTKCKLELDSLHGELLDRYFELCRTEDDSFDYSLLPNDGYIYYFLGYHIYKSNRSHLFSEIFLDLSFVVNKIRFTGPSDLLNDYLNYKEHFKNNLDKYHDFVTFIATNADLLCDLNIDVLQLALCQPNDSIVYKNALDSVVNSDKLYLKWCNQSNVKSSKILSARLHSGSVRFAVFDRKKDMIVSVGSDKVVKIWDSNTGKQLRSLKGHENTINCCQINCDGSLLITASDDGTVKLWEMNSEELFSNSNELWSPRPRSGSQYPHICNGNAVIDDSNDTYRGHSLQSSGDSQIEVKCCAFSPIHKHLVISGASDKCLHIWSTEDLKTLHILNGHKYSVNSCHFSSNSELIVSASGEEVIVWCASKGIKLQELKHEMNVENCIFNSSLNYIYTSSGRYVYKWSSSGKTEPICKYNNLKTKYYVTHCAVSPNGKYIAGGTTRDQVVIWMTDSYSRIAVATFKCADKINSINFNNESTKLLSCCDDGSVIIWDTSKPFGASMVALRKKFAVQYQRTDLKVLTPDENGTIRLFEGIEGKENRTLALRPNPMQKDLQSSVTYDITCCALSYNSDILFGTSDGELILHQNSTNETYFLERHEKEVTFCAFIDGQNKLISASKDSTFRTFRRFSLTFEKPKYSAKLESNEDSVLMDVEMGPIVSCKLFAKDNKAMIWCENGSLFVIDMRWNRLIAFCEHQSQINSADITITEELIATVSSDHAVKLWRSSLELDSTKKNEIFFIRLIKSLSCPRSCRFAPNGDFLVIGHDSGAINLWNFNATESKKLQRFEDSHSDWVNDIAIAPNGQLIISIGKSIKFWNREGVLLQTFKTNGGSMSSIYTNFVDNRQSGDPNDFNKLVTVDDAGVLYILQILNFH